MKKFILFLVLFLTAVSASSEPLSVQVDQGTGFIHIATRSFDVSGLTDIGANIPEGCKVAYVSVYNGDLLINCKADLATGAMPLGVIIASGTKDFPLSGISTVPGRVLDIWARPNNVSSLSVRLSGWR